MTAPEPEAVPLAARLLRPVPMHIYLDGAFAYAHPVGASALSREEIVVWTLDPAEEAEGLAPPSPIYRLSLVIGSPRTPVLVPPRAHYVATVTMPTTISPHLAPAWAAIVHVFAERTD